MSKYGISNAVLCRESMKKQQIDTNQKLLETKEKKKCANQYQLRKAYDEARQNLVKK